jgi:hypothetical protein
MSKETKVLHIKISESMPLEEASQLAERLVETLSDDYRVVITPDGANITIYDPVIFRDISHKLNTIIERLSRPTHIIKCDSNNIESLLEQLPTGIIRQPEITD